MGSKLSVPHRMWTRDEKLQIVRLRIEQNLTPKELSKRFGVNPSLIYVWCKQYSEHGAERLRSQNGIPRLQPITQKKEECILNNNNDDPHVDYSVRKKMTGNWIRHHRKMAGYTQSEVADAIGITQQHFSRIESGKWSITLENMEKMRSVLNFTLNEYEAYIDNPSVEISVATCDDIASIQHLDLQLPEKALTTAIQQQQVYVLKTPWALVGVCCFSIVWQEPYLNTLFVDQEYRKQGYDKEFISFWENAMKGHGYDSVLVSTPSDDTTKYFYEKLGYQYVGFVQTKTRTNEELMYRKYLSVKS